VTEWVKLLKEAAEHVGAPIQDGVCELFPNERTCDQETGKSIRVPGSFNPKTGEAGKIIGETIQPLIAFSRTSAGAKERQYGKTNERTRGSFP
jgi:hypothetical protein